MQQIHTLSVVLGNYSYSSYSFPRERLYRAWSQVAAALQRAATESASRHTERASQASAAAVPQEVSSLPRPWCPRPRPDGHGRDQRGVSGSNRPRPPRLSGSDQIATAPRPWQPPRPLFVPPGQSGDRAGDLKTMSFRDLKTDRDPWAHLTTESRSMRRHDRPVCRLGRLQKWLGQPLRQRSSQCRQRRFRSAF